MPLDQWPLGRPLRAVRCAVVQGQTSFRTTTDHGFHATTMGSSKKQEPLLKISQMHDARSASPALDETHGSG